MNTYETFYFRRSNQTTLSEYYTDNNWTFTLSISGNVTILPSYSPEQLNEIPLRNSWNGHTPEEVLACGKDILAEELFANKEPCYSEVEALLPPITENSYCFLSGATSWSGVLIDKQGQIFPQTNGCVRNPDPIFSPVLVDGHLGEVEPKQFLLDKRYPLLFSVHKEAQNILEFLYFVEPGDTNRDPIVWIRSKWYSLSNPASCTIDYQIASLSRYTGRKIEAETFLTALMDTVIYWVKFANTGSQIEIPEKVLQNVTYGTQMFCAATFSADHAHYGHLHYGEEIHDNFPPNYIWTLETCFLWGRNAWAQRIWQHLLIYVLNDEGRFVYRQGEHELFGASAVEYGQLLFVAEQYHEKLDSAHWPEEYWEKITGMGNVLLANCVSCSEFDNRTFIRMCAEADTNSRVHVYLNNNLWGIRGLRALASLLTESGRIYESTPYTEMADILEKNIVFLTQTNSKQSNFGKLVPFRFGYSAMPYTLSTCQDTAKPLSSADLRKYLIASHMRAEGNNVQDLTENTYANYRYYLEALSTMLLPPSYAESIISLREAIGGECLGMTRFYSWLDDWPVIHYAKYLLETNAIPKYILLLYAHTAHHGNPKLMCYYEQVSIDGKVKAPDCVPSLLTTALMTAWMFAYETVEKRELLLLSAIPESWFNQSFHAYKIGFSSGTCSFHYENNRLDLEFSIPPRQDTVLVWRGRKHLCAEDIIQGISAVEQIDGNRILLKKGIRCVTFEIAQNHPAL